MSCPRQKVQLFVFVHKVVGGSNMGLVVDDNEEEEEKLFFVVVVFLLFLPRLTVRLE